MTSLAKNSYKSPSPPPSVASTTSSTSDSSSSSDSDSSDANEEGQLEGEGVVVPGVEERTYLAEVDHDGVSYALGDVVHLLPSRYTSLPSYHFVLLPLSLPSSSSSILCVVNFFILHILVVVNDKVKVEERKPQVVLIEGLWTDRDDNKVWCLCVVWSHGWMYSLSVRQSLLPPPPPPAPHTHTHTHTHTCSGWTAVGTTILKKLFIWLHESSTRRYNDESTATNVVVCCSYMLVYMG